METTIKCPTCGEQHDQSRTLSFDGKGINSCGVFRPRLATLSDGCPAEIGQLFAAAPDLLAQAEQCVAWYRRMSIEERDWPEFAREALAAIAKARATS